VASVRAWSPAEPVDIVSTFPSFPRRRRESEPASGTRSA